MITVAVVLMKNNVNNKPAKVVSATDKGRGRIRPKIGPLQNQLQKYPKRCRMRRRVFLDHIQVNLESYKRFPRVITTWYFYPMKTLYF